MAIEFTQEQLNSIWDGATGDRDAMSKRQRYYDGDHDIVTDNAGKQYADGADKSARVTNFIAYGVDMYTGALTSTPWQVTAGDTVDDDVDGTGVADGVGVPQVDSASTNVDVGVYADVADAQGLDAQDIENLRNALLKGRGIEVHSYDKDAKEIVITNYDPTEWVIVRDTEDTLIAAIRRVELDAGTVYDGDVLDKDIELMTVYDDAKIVTYKRVKGEDSKTGQKDATWEQVSEQTHFYKAVPVVEWYTNKRRRSIISDALIAQNDEYNSVDSASGDDIRREVDALLKIWGLGADWLKENAQLLKDLRIIPFDEGKDAQDADYISHTADTDRVMQRLERTRQHIHIMGRVPDVSKIVGSTGATSGIALKLMFTPMENAARSMITCLRLCMRERINLINRIQVYKRDAIVDDYETVINFAVPVNRLEEWQYIGNLTGIVSHMKQLQLLSDVDDPQSEMLRLEQEGALDAEPVGDVAVEANMAANDAKVNAAAAQNAQTVGTQIDEMAQRMVDALEQLVLTRMPTPKGPPSGAAA